MQNPFRRSTVNGRGWTSFKLVRTRSDKLKIQIHPDDFGRIPELQKAAKSTPSDSDDHRFKLVWTSSRVRTNADRRIQKIVRTSFKIYHVRRRMSSDELQTRTFGRNVRQIANSSGRDAQLIANSITPTRPSTIGGLTSGRVRMDCKFHPARRP